MGLGRKGLCIVLTLAVLGLSGCSWTDPAAFGKTKNPADPVNADRVSVEAEEAMLPRRAEHMTVSREISIDNRWKKQ